MSRQFCPHHKDILEYQEGKLKNIHIRGFSLENNHRLFHHFERVRLAIAEHYSLHLEYRKRGTKTTQRYTVRPYRLTHQNGVWYLLAEDKGLIKSFCLSRIQGLRIEETAFSPDEHILKRIDMENSIYFQERIPKIHLSIAPVAADYFLRRRLLLNQKILAESQEGCLKPICRNLHEREILPWCNTGCRTSPSTAPASCPKN